MTEFCPVLPTKLFTVLDVYAPGAWHFLHAPQVVSADGDRIVKWLGRWHCTVILDCFAYELQGKLPCFKDVYEAATILRDTCAELIVVCPDVLKDGNQSLELLKQHGPALSGYGRLMAVPHGVNLSSWMSWAEQCIDFCRNLGIGQPIIGLPRYMSEWGIQTRYRAATWLHHYYHAVVHLLGAGEGLREAHLASQAPSVTSCDSTAPFAYAMRHGIATRVENFWDDKVEMRSEWWSQDIHNTTGYEVRAAQLNIALWKEALRSASFINAEPYSIG